MEPPWAASLLPRAADLSLQNIRLAVYPCEQKKGPEKLDPCFIGMCSPYSRLPMNCSRNINRFMKSKYSCKYLPFEICTESEDEVQADIVESEVGRAVEAVISSFADLGSEGVSSIPHDP